MIYDILKDFNKFLANYPDLQLLKQNVILTAKFSKKNETLIIVTTKIPIAELKKPWIILLIKGESMLLNYR